MDATLARVAIAPPLLLKWLATSALAFLDEADERLLREGVWINRCSQVDSCIWLHGNLPPCRKLLSLWIETEASGLALGKSDLDRSKLCPICHQDPLLVHLADGPLGCLEGVDSDKCTACTCCGTSRIDQENLQDLPVLIEGGLQHLLCGLHGQAADKELNPTFDTLHHWPPVLGLVGAFSAVAGRTRAAALSMAAVTAALAAAALAAAAAAAAAALPAPAASMASAAALARRGASIPRFGAVFAGRRAFALPTLAMPPAPTLPSTAACAAAGVTPGTARSWAACSAAFTAAVALTGLG
mmetsp:Transcript_122459/g.357553  ORF Transcript_122459/g.357553 Transcript_122459/m.357553 type:complete len:299 (+) Transcript_122459:926-1822(+)